MTRLGELAMVTAMIAAAALGGRAAVEISASTEAARTRTTAGGKFAGQAVTALPQEKKMSASRMVSLAPVMIVDEIEPCLVFWEKLGFAKTAEVPEGSKLGFVMLARDGVTVMYQSRASVVKDVPAMAKEPSRMALFLTVTGLDEIKSHLTGAPVMVPERTTFYGSREVGVREPGGNIVTFAEFAGRQN